ncbi:MAG TPA: restriction endonuclease subunit S [bacterium]|nr:restriction endonuclease subunit S [bacterium]
MNKNNENNTSTKLSAGLVPKLRFPEFVNDGEWCYPNGDELFEPIANKNHNSDLPILAITQDKGAVPRDMIDYHVSVTDKSVESYKVVEIGDFIISLRSFQGGIEYSFYKGLCSPAYIILRKKINLENDFYRHYFKSVPFIRDLNRNLEGIRDGKMISYKQFSEILIPKPKLKEQQKIASCLLSLDEVITAENQKLEVLKDHKKGLLQNLFPQEGETVPKKRFKEFVANGVWEDKELGFLAENLDSKRVPITSNQREKGEIPYYGASGIIDYVKEHIYDENLLCISEDGANLIDRNYPIAFSISGKTWVNNHAHVLKFESIYTQLLVEKYINSIKIEGFLTGMAQPKLNRAKLDIIPIPLPKNPKEQQKIATCLSSIDEIISAQSQKVEALKLHKKGLLQGLFPGVNET